MQFLFFSNFGQYPLSLICSPSSVFISQSQAQQKQDILNKKQTNPYKLSISYTFIQIIIFRQKQENKPMLRRLTKSIRFGIVNQSKIINPYTHDPIKTKAYITQTQLFDRVTQCSRDFRQWRKVGVKERKQRVAKFVQSVLQDKQMLKPLISDFTGKSYKNIEEEFRRITNVSTNLIQNSDLTLKQQTKHTKFLNNSYNVTITQDPVGLAMIFPYFSQPIFDSLIHLIPCLISGNGALLKVSDYNHFLGEYMNKKCNQVLGYKNLINDAFISPQQLPIVREFRPIKKLNFAGSRSSARRIFQVMVENRFIDCNLFYGAQEAAYVDETADLELAANSICKNAFYNNGQSYDCIRRLYVHKDVQEKLLQMLADRIQKIKLGDPKDPQTDLGPITIQQSILRFQQLINDAINLDAKCVIGGLTTTDGKTKGLFCEPTLLTNCDPNMQVIQQHVNAPLLCVSIVEGFNNFEAEVEDNSYGTGIRIFTKDPSKYKNVVSQLEVGIISFNSGCIIDSDLPIEGWKGSGKGKILSELSYEEFVVPKCFVIHDS